MTQKVSYEKELKEQVATSRAAIELIKIVSDLWYDKSMELVLFRNPLFDQNVSEILHLVDSARRFVQKPISVNDVLNVAHEIANMDLPPSRIDVGKLTYEYMEEGEKTDLKEYLENALSGAKDFSELKPRDVVLYGFGRIGRLLARELMMQTGKGSQLRLRAIVTRGKLDETTLEKRASLLRDDSVHDDFPGTVTVDVEKPALIINGMTVHMISSNSPDSIDYTQYGIEDALVLDNTGVWRDEEGLGLHLKSKGVSKVLLTAPGKGNIPNIVFGVNEDTLDVDNTDIFSAASCTTNAITPVLYAVEQTYGIEQGHLETIHSYTNDQNLVDNFHKKYRRGRAAAINMVITTTGAGSAVAKAVHSLKGKLTSSAIRVPVPNGSLAVLNLTLKKPASVEEMNDTIKDYALNGKLVEQIKYSMNNELVSSDIVGVAAPAIYDSKATIASEKDRKVVLYVWYDNEYGYAHQVIRLAKHIAKVRRYRYF